MLLGLHRGGNGITLFASYERLDVIALSLIAAIGHRQLGANISFDLDKRIVDDLQMIGQIGGARDRVSAG